MKLADHDLSTQNRHLSEVVHPAAVMGPRHVVILLACYNGGDHLRAQLDSLEAQDHADWSLVVSDDGSTDAGVSVLINFARLHPNRRITILEGPRVGFAQNFLSLLRAADPKAPFVAICDQDDIWLPHKLARALDHLGDAEGPALYGTRTEICSDALSHLGLSPHFEKPPCFRNALVQSIAGGNTMVLNRAALALLKRAAQPPVRIVSHDWWAYQIISGAGGQIIYDKEPTLRYRQHARNLVGSNQGALARLHRIVRLLRGEFRGWSDTNLAAMEQARACLTPENQDLLRKFANIRRRGPFGRVTGISQLGLFRQTRAGHVALIVAAFLGKL